jgi:hypothetical protein
LGGVTVDNKAQPGNINLWGYDESTRCKRQTEKKNNRFMLASTQSP